MRVKALFLASLLLLTLISSTIARAELKNNFLLGGELGIESRHSHFTSRYQIVGFPAVPAPFNTLMNVNSVRVADAGSFAGLLGGWQLHCSRWLAGIEANVDFHSFEKHKDFVISDVLVLAAPAQLGPAAATVEYDRGDTFGLTLRGGFWVTPFFMTYVKAGVQYSRDELTFVIPTRQLINEPISFGKEDIWGLLGGIGIELPAFANSSVRFEYNYIRTDRLVLEDNVGIMVGVHRIKYPESHVGKIAWVWNFM